MITELLSRAIEQNQLEQCILSGFENYQFAPSGAAFTKATVSQSGRVAKIKVYQGSGPQLTPDLIGQLLTFTLKSYMAKNNQIYISGFWNDKAQQAPQQGQQAPPQARQATNPPPGIDTESQILAMAERFLKAIEAMMYPKATAERPTQPSGPNPDYVGDNPPSPDDDQIPF